MKTTAMAAKVVLIVLQHIVKNVNKRWRPPEHISESMKARLKILLPMGIDEDEDGRILSWLRRQQ